MGRIEILFNYRQAIRQAEKLENLSSRLKKLARDKLSDTMGKLQNCWQSDHSNEYLRKVDLVRAELNETAARMESVAHAIRETAEAVKNAELRALEIARKRTYEG